MYLLQSEFKSHLVQLHFLQNFLETARCLFCVHRHALNVRFVLFRKK